MSQTNNQGTAPGLSYVSGTSDTPLLFLTVGQVMEQAVAQWGEREALVIPHQNVRLSYAELNAMVDEFAAGLVAFSSA